MQEAQLPLRQILAAAVGIEQHRLYSARSLQQQRHRIDAEVAAGQIGLQSPLAHHRVLRRQRVVLPAGAGQIEQHPMQFQFHRAVGGMQAAEAQGLRL